MKKKLLTIILSILAVLSFTIGLTGCNDDKIQELSKQIEELNRKIEVLQDMIGANEQGLEFCLKDDGTYGVSVGMAKNLSNIVIPSTYLGKDVTEINEYAFENDTKLTSITIPNSVESIGYWAFGGCRSLTKVNYSGTIDSWCEIEFSGNVSNPLYYTKNLYINDKLVTEAVITTATKINNYAFLGCSSLTSVTIPDSVESIGEDAFSYCSSLTSVTIPNSVTSIGGSAFYNCSSLTSVTIGASVESIGEGAFSACSSLTKVNYLGTIDGWCEIEFSNYVSNPLYYTKNLYINDKLITEAVITTATKINNYAFSDCSKLTSVTISNSVQSIGKYAFSDCSKLTSVTIPNSVQSIGEDAFVGCSSLTKVNYLGTIDSWCEIEFSGYFSNSLYYADNFYINDKLITEAVITTATKINDYAFSDCSKLTSVTIGDSVTSIGEYAFCNCSSLESITIPNSVTSIGYEAFYGCSSLESVTIGENVTSIGSSAFYNCSSLTSITFSDTTGWYRVYYYGDWQNKTGGTATNVTTPTTNATYFKSTYCNYYWYKIDE